MSPSLRSLGVQPFFSKRVRDDGQRGRMVVPDLLGRDGELHLEVPQRVWKVEVQVGVLPSLGLCQALDRACLSRFRLFLT